MMVHRNFLFHFDFLELLQVILFFHNILSIEINISFQFPSQGSERFWSSRWSPLQGMAEVRAALS